MNTTPLDFTPHRCSASPAFCTASAWMNAALGKSLEALLCRYVRHLERQVSRLEPKGH
jgi:hypothetical protein